MLADLEDLLGHSMNDPSLLEVARTHTSHAHEHGTVDNERLEFLGDAVLELVATEHLFERYPGVAEGRLSRARSQLVCRETLASWARGLKLGSFLRLGAGAEQSGMRDQDRALANVLEAIVGAVYLDGGIEAARSFLVPLMNTPLLGADEGLESFAKNPVSELQEWAQGQGLELPTYLSRSIGEAHTPQSGWAVEVHISGQASHTARGATKSLARRRAAALALASVLDAPPPTKGS
jgi:ribonuclease-3